MNENEKRMYSEVYGILKLLGEKYIKLLPIELYKLICDNRDCNNIIILKTSRF